MPQSISTRTARRERRERMSTAILFFRRAMAVAILLLGISSAAATGDDYAGVVGSHFMELHPRAGSRLLAVKEGDRCDTYSKNVCPGVKAKGDAQLLHCCKNQCLNVLSDRNNCGRCGNKCGFGRLCCRGKCAAVAYDAKNCGDCGKACAPGLRCEYGICEYA